MQILSNKKLAIWDFDGTIADSEPLHMLAYQRVFDEVIPEQGAIDAKFYMYEVASLGGGPARLCEVFRLPFDVEELKARKRVHYDVYTKDGSIKLFPEIATVMQLQKQLGMAVMIASNTKPAVNRAVLETNGFDPEAIDFYVGPEADMPRKPDPAMFLHALKKSGFAAQDAVVFEDTYIGVQAGVGAGIDTVYLKADHNSHIPPPDDCLASDRSALLSYYQTL